MRIKSARGGLSNYSAMKWQPIATAPYNVDLELAVIDRLGTHKLVFPSRRIPVGWLKSETDEWVEVHPTHWREWESLSPS